MDKPLTLFGIGMLGFGSLLTFTTITFTAANTEPFPPAYTPKHFQMQPFTEEEKAELATQAQERLTTAFAEGKITQEEYDNLLSKLENGEPLFIKLHNKENREPRPHSVRVFNTGNEVSLRRENEELTEEEKAELKSKVKEKLTTALAEGKITQEEYDSFLADLGSGTSVPMNVLKEEKFSFFKSTPKELSEEEKAEIQAQHREKLTQELANGNITQEQYDKMLTRLETFTFPMMRR